MGIDKTQLRGLMRRVLREVPRLYSEDVVELLMMTCATESHLGTFIRQKGGGPAKGIFQVERATCRDHYNNYLRWNDKLSRQIELVSGIGLPDMLALEGNIIYGILMARLVYFRSPLPIPSTIEGMARMYKKVYNTAGGKGSAAKALADYKRLCL